MAASKPDSSSGRFSYDGLERAMHEKARLGMLTSLMAHPDGLLFSDLKDLCALTDGNLNRHLKVLQDEGLVEVWKGTKHNRPQTLCRITPEGRSRFLEYIETLEKVIADAAAAARAAPSPATARILKGLSPA
ncbi:MAG: transcriptional regulator [Planctomycetia bacterium]|nr:transcriptional regulator [Planctomycetia bacterium]